jgi:hypothetical protein
VARPEFCVQKLYTVNRNLPIVNYVSLKP